MLQLLHQFQKTLPHHITLVKLAIVKLLMSYYYYYLDLFSPLSLSLSLSHSYLNGCCISFVYCPQYLVHLRNHFPTLIHLSYPNFMVSHKVPFTAYLTRPYSDIGHTCSLAALVSCHVTAQHSTQALPVCLPIYQSIHL